MPPASFADFTAAADAVAATRSKLRKRDVLADYLRRLSPRDLSLACSYLVGRPLPEAGDRLGLGWVQQAAALTAAAATDGEALQASYLRHSDAGDVAAELLTGRQRSGGRLRLTDLAAAFHAMATSSRGEERTRHLAELYRRADPSEARYLARIVAREMRIGLREGLLEEAIATAFDVSLDAVRRAHMLLGDAGETALLAQEGALERAGLRLGRPVRFMLASPLADATEVMRRVAGEAWIEDKYDGIRAQLHLTDDGPRLFSRDLNDVSSSFPEIVNATRTLPERAVIDGELVPFRAGAVLDFASLQTRLGRVRPSDALVAEVPVVLVAFDLLHLDGRDLIDAPLRERRAELERLTLPERTAERILHARLSTACSTDEVDAHFDDARARRNEGLMVKDPESSYQPGRRGLGWLKLKRALATLDCVVVGVEWGHGKRRGVLSDYTFAVRAGEGDRLLTIGKAYTGLTDAEIARMTEHFKTITTRDLGRYRFVQPEVVVEIAFDRIQRSSRHDSGFALRFPRIVRLRNDKTPAEIDDLGAVEALHAAQATGRILLATGARGETEQIATGDGRSAPPRDR
jgi:DNA ligase 1